MRSWKTFILFLFFLSLSCAREEKITISETPPISLETAEVAVANLESVIANLEDKITKLEELPALKSIIPEHAAEKKIETQNVVERLEELERRITDLEERLSRLKGG